MATTFGGAELGVLLSDDELGSLPGFVTPSFVVRRPYPGGDDESLQMIGTGRPTAVFECHVTDTEYSALVLLMQTEDELIIGADTYPTATLTALTDVVVLLNGDRRFRAEFVITTGA